VTGAVVEPREQEEQPVDLIKRYDSARVGHSQQGRAVGGSRDRDGTARDVVALRVEQVGDEQFE
jgi:hypothetical protein